MISHSGRVLSHLTGRAVCAAAALQAERPVSWPCARLNVENCCRAVHRHCQAGSDARPPETFMGVSGNDMSSLQSNSGRGEDGSIKSSNTCHDAEPAAPHHTRYSVAGPAPLRLWSSAPTWAAQHH